MTTRSKLILRFAGGPLVCIAALTVHHRVTAGTWAFPWIPVIVLLPLAALGIWYYGNPERASRLQTLRDERTAQRQREIEEAKHLPS